MKRKSVKTKRKTKGSEQFKNFAIAILAVVLLVVIAASTKDYFKIGTSKAASPVIETPYTYIKATSRSGSEPRYGKVYHYDPIWGFGTGFPNELYSGNCIKPTIAGNFVYCLKVNASFPDGGAPISTTPIKIDVTSGSNYGKVTALKVPNGTPPDANWNVLAPANNGSYILGRMDVPLHPLTGPIYIMDSSGAVIYTATGSYFHPILSADGTKAAWSYKEGDPVAIFGNRDLFVFDVASKTSKKIYDVTVGAESYSPSLSKNGLMVAFGVATGSTTAGQWDQVIYVANTATSVAQRVDVSQIPGDGYRWNASPKIMSNGKGVVWEAIKDMRTTVGYNLLAAPLAESTPLSGPAFEIFPYSAAAKRRLPDIDNKGVVLFSKNISWSNYEIWVTRAFKGATMFRFLPPTSGTNGDVSFFRV